jgi:hypothetical protein
MKTRLYPIIFLLAFASCNTQEVCDDDSQSILVARFRTRVSGEIIDTLVPGISIFGIREGKPDSLLYDSATVSKIELPLDPGHDLSRFVMSTEEKTDTLILKHSSEAYLISYSCGFAARFVLEELDHSGGMIVDMELISSSVDAELETNEEHLWIYY